MTDLMQIVGFISGDAANYVYYAKQSPLMAKSYAQDVRKSYKHLLRKIKAVANA